MTDHDRTVIYSGNENGNGNDGTGRLPSFSELAFTEDQPADLSTGLVSLGFLSSAIRRGLRLWGALAIIGLLIGVGSYVKFPPAFKASTSVLLTYGPNEAPDSAVFDNQAIAESHAVAGLAMEKLKIHDSIGNFAAGYTVAVVTDRVLQFTASAPSSGGAVDRANAIASAFLQFRADQAKTAQRVLVQSLDKEVEQAKGNLAALDKQISDVQAQPPASDKDSKLKSLQGQREQAQVALGVLQQTAAGAQAGSSTLSAISGSLVLDAATPLPHSKTKGMLIYGAYGLIGGLAIGIGIVIVRAITSDRLRRRDDVARALGAPVRLSVGPVRLAGRLPRSARGLDAAGDAPVRTIVSHLREITPAGRGGALAALAVVAVGDPRVAALAVVALAQAEAEDGRKVVVADLAAGSPAATLLGSSEPGVRVVSAGKARFVLAVPEPGQIAPAGPAGRADAGERHGEFTAATSRAAGSADLMLSVVTLDPSLGADHLSSWAPAAVAMVTAGEASWTRIHAAGEMTRLAGTSLESAILVGADRADESIGVTAGPSRPAAGRRRAWIGANGR